MLTNNKRFVEGTVLPAERCDFVGVKLEKVHELFPVCRTVFVGKECCFIIWLNKAYCTTKVCVINTQSSICINLLK